LNSYLYCFQILSAMDKRAEKLLKKDTAEAGETVIQLFFELYFE
jgi:hypothetical protein